MTIKQRFLKSLFQIGLSLIITGLIIVMGTGVLTKVNWISDKNGRFDQTILEEPNLTKLTDNLDNQPYDYILFNDSVDKRVASKFQKSDSQFYSYVLQNKSSSVFGNTYYQLYVLDQLNLIVRQPLEQEFVSPLFRKISVLTVQIIFFLVVSVVVIMLFLTKLMEELFVAFHDIRDATLMIGVEPTIDYPEKYKEFNDILSTLGQRNEELLALMSQQKLEKESLAFQVASLSHDIKTPITIVKGNIELLELSRFNEKEQSYLKSIKDSIEILENYFNALIMYSRLQLADDNYDDIVAIEDLLAGVKKEIANILLLENIQFEIFNQTNKESVFGNPLNLERALVNILINAIRHAGEDGKVTLTLKEDKCYLHFKIWNSGSPFSDIALESAKTLFFTEDKSRNTKHYGIGIPFATVVSEKHGGSLTLFNPENGGAQVDIAIKK